MARDPQQIFYYHNKIVLRSLVLATLIFVGLLLFLSWRNLEGVETPAVPPRAIQHFTDKVSDPYVVQHYGSGARYIHDIERYPEIRERFFERTSLDFSSGFMLEAELAEVKAARERAVDGIRQHVYATSYYIGNLLVLPEVTLYEQLTDNRPKTTALLEAALADIRAGSVKISSVYDVAPPYFYEPGLANAVYYQTPSSPSLTVSEVAMVLYLLAVIDPVRARLYEEQLADYTDQVLVSGAHFPSDIQAALDLAALYHDIIVDHPDYQSLIERAKSEWSGLDGVSRVRTEPVTERQFIIRDFPYQSSFFIDRIVNYSYTPQAPQEQPTGSLFLTLKDVRIPQVGSRLYAYNWETDVILPTALDLLPRQYPSLLETLEHASYQSQDTYFFVSSDATDSRLLRREGKEVTIIDGLEELERFTDVEILAGTDLVLLAEEKVTAGKQFHFIDTTDNRATIVRTLTDAIHATILDEDTVLYVDTRGEVWSSHSTSGTKRLEGIQPLSTSTASHLRTIHLNRENELLMVVDTTINSSTLIPETEVTLYQFTTTDQTTVEPVYSVVFVDTKVMSGELSPGGRYLALVASTALSGRQPKVLLFDIMNGIIKKEIDISNFDPSTAALDGWIIF